jgi:sec-independent protein translocase protein TatB
MFDIGFGELLLLAVVALVVLGPERLPGAARTVGTILRRLRSGWDSVREEVEREIEAEEMKRNLKEAQEHIRRAGEQVRDGVEQVRDEVRDSAEQVRKAADSVTGSPPDEEDTVTRTSTRRGPVDGDHKDGSSGAGHEH